MLHKVAGDEADGDISSESETVMGTGEEETETDKVDVEGDDDSLSLATFPSFTGHGTPVCGTNRRLSINTLNTP